MCSSHFVCLLVNSQLKLLMQVIYIQPNVKFALPSSFLFIYWHLNNQTYFYISIQIKIALTSCLLYGINSFADGFETFQTISMKLTCFRNLIFIGRTKEKPQMHSPHY